MNYPLMKARNSCLAFVFLILFVTSLSWGATVRFDGLYEGRFEKDTCYIRFYPDGSVVEAWGSDRSSVGKWIKRNNKLPEGKYTITNNKIQFTLEQMGGEVDYAGTIRDDGIDLEWHSRINDRKARAFYKFVKVPLVADSGKTKLPSEIKPSKTKIDGIQSGAWITEIVYYDDYGRPARSDLVNKKGEIVVRRGCIFAAFQLVQSLLAYGGPLKQGAICDIDPNEIFFITDHDPQGNPKTPRFICLDKDGNIIMAEKRPLLIKTFSAAQKSESKVIYTGAFKDKAYIRIFPCDNCAKQTGNSKTAYVWPLR